MRAIVSELVTTQMRGSALWVTLSRPEAFNAMNLEVIAALEGALERAETDHIVRALILTGAGRAFCTGEDLESVPVGATEAETVLGITRFLGTAAHMYRRLEQLRVPTIAVVNGIALAGGAELLLCCDYVVADSSARLGEGHAKFGQIPGGGDSVRLSRQIGISRAKYLMFTGEILTAQRAS